MVLKSGTQQLEKRIQELKQFVDLELGQALGADEPTVSSLTSIRQTLDTLKPALQHPKLKIKAVAEEPALISELKAVYEKQLTLKTLFDFEPAMFSEPNSIAFGDIVIWLARPDTALSEAFKSFAQQLIPHTALKLILIRVLPVEALEPASPNQLADTDSQWLSKHVPQLMPVVVPLCFKSILRLPEQVAASNSVTTESVASQQESKRRQESSAKAASSRIRERKRRTEKNRVEKKQSERASAQSPITNFCNLLEQLAKNNQEAIAYQPVIAALIQITDQLMNMLSTKEQQLSYQLSSEKAKIATAGEINVQQQVGIVFRKADQKVDEVISKSRADVSTLKGVLLDAQDVRSIKSQLQQQINTLYPVVSDLQGTIELELFPQDKADIHQTLVQLTGDFLNSWSQKAWRRIFDAPHRDGLYQLCEMLPQIITLAPVLSPSQPEIFQTKLNPTFNIQHLFNSEFKASFVWCRRYKFPTFIKFVFKDLRTNLMAVTGLVMLLSYVLNMAPEKEAAATTSTALIHSAAATIDMFSWFQGMNPNLKGISILLFFPFALKTSMITYREDKEAKQEAETEKLLQEGNKHYQTIAIAYVNKFIDFLNTQLDEVEHALKYELNELKLIYSNTLAEVNKAIAHYRLGLKQVGDAQKRLRKIRELI